MKFIDGSLAPDSYLEKLHKFVEEACGDDPGEQGEPERFEDAFMQEIRKLENQGWRLCAGCRENVDCPSCSIETRKIMGLPPET